MSNTELSLSDSIRLKGIALLLLLFHHLFYISNGLYDDFTVAGVALVETISQVAKLCVALFVFLSGYGLMASTGKLQKFNWRNFYVKGFTKLYLNYWFMWLMFVPVGIFIFGRTFKDVYQVHVGLKWFIDFFGFSNSFGYLGYNATWWFL